MNTSTPPVSPPPEPEAESHGLSFIDEIFYWLFQHWLLIVNTLVLLYGGIPWLSPLLISLGSTRLGEFLFWLYTPLCHQSSANSPYLFGHQVAFCTREAAMYTTLFVGGLIYAQVRTRLVRHPLPMWAFFLLLLPIFLDGSSQTVDALLPGLGLRSPNDMPGSFNWWMRVLSGVLFAVAVILAVYPRLDRDLRGVDVHSSHKGV